MSARFENAVHFAQSAVEILKVAYAESGCDSVETVVVERKIQAVVLFERDYVGQLFVLNLVSADVHHSL